MLELHEGVMCSRDVTRAASAGADSGGGLDHGADHFGMLPHAEIVVGTPDHDGVGPIRGVPYGVRKPSRDALKVGKNPVAPLIMQAVESGTEELTVIHRENLKTGPEAGAAAPF